MRLQIWQRRGMSAVVVLLAFLVVAATLVSSFQWINRPFPGFFLYGNLTVGPDYLPQWTGKKAGLRFLDRIVAVEDRPVERSSEVYDIVHSRPPGSSFRYTVDRGGTPLFMEIPSLGLTFYDWLLTYGIYLVTALGFLIIGVTPLYHRSASAPAAPLFFMVTAIFFWFATSFDFVTAQALPRELRAFSFALTPGIGVHLGLLLAGGRERCGGRRLYLFLAYGASVLLGAAYSLTFYGPLEVWRWVLRLGYFYSLVAALIFLLLIWFGLRRPASDLERSRLRVILVGSLIGFFLPTFGTVLASSFSWEIPYNLLLIPAVFFPLSVAFALLKYNLFDIDSVLKLSLSRGAITGVLLLIYVLVVSVLSLSLGIYARDPLVPFFFSILIALAFNPLLRWIEKAMDRYLYRKEYDPVELQREVSLLLRSLSRPKATAERFLKLLADRMLVERPFLVFRPGEEERYLTVSLNGATEGLRDLSFELGAPWMHHFEIYKGGISKDELKTNPAYEANRSDLLRLFEQFQVELLLPVIFEGRLLGLVSLGGKRSGRGYSADDFRLLSTLVDQLALSLKNGMLFEESEEAKENYRLLYDQSQALNDKLLEVDRLKKQFVANISHELRTPISTVLGYMEVLLDPGFAGDRGAILERLVSSGRDLSHLMDSLLDFSRMEAGSMTTSLEEVNLRELLQSLEIMAQRLIKGRPIRFQCQIDRSRDVVRTDPKKLQQILLHLLTNALKFTERGDIAVRMKLHEVGEHGFAEFSVSDTGIGISERDQEVIFEEFRQLDGSSTRQYGGTGLGLSLCQKLARSLGGRIKVQSQLGQGSTFSLILPVSAPGPQAASEVRAG